MFLNQNTADSNSLDRSRKQWLLHKNVLFGTKIRCTGVANADFRLKSARQAPQTVICWCKFVNFTQHPMHRGRTCWFWTQKRSTGVANPMHRCRKQWCGMLFNQTKSSKIVIKKYFNLTKLDGAYLQAMPTCRCVFSKKYSKTVFKKSFNLSKLDGAYLISI